MTLTPEEAAAQGASIRAAGDRTLQQYHNWMQTNAASHLMRTAREVGITERLRERQHTLDELCQSLSLDPDTTALLLDALVAIGYVEQYREDFTLARAGHLLCQYDDDLGDQKWNTLAQRLRKVSGASEDDEDGAIDVEAYRDHLAATQWIHSSAAVQAAEILNIGGQDAPAGLRILDLGCGSGVWSCAMAHQDAESTVVAIDQAGPLQAARTTADSIGLGDRFQTIESDPRLATLTEQAFDLVIIAQQLSVWGDEQALALLRKAAGAVKPGGRLVAPDLYAGPSRAGLDEAAGALTIHLQTPGGRVRDLREAQQMFQQAGLQSIQFTFLAASQEGLGMVVAER
ncbi:class I SAM-dependent methyltransferase [Roseiconus nitratireducens]|uniref:Class I SAM-dependent methyltransferase n=1 Tax=Roseiconus nitratireducens TaxID=2605748 RepID=A0A5M6DAN5_9BACT|nr:class I SAM-dependent methyltransferase [Roseiconus nitratireducens]KAA5544618.1 class I SAM-dependent methyltransferase [Roseiconus nitratireducens]